MEPIIYDVQTDNQGNWGLEIENIFESGLHSAIVKTPEGQKVDVLLFNIEDQLTLPQIKAIDFDSSFSLVAFLILASSLLVYSLYTIRLGKKIDVCQVAREKEALTKRKKFTHQAAAVSFLVFIIAVTTIYGIVRDQEIAVQQQLQDELSQQLPDKQVNLKGVVYRPFDRQPVEGVDLKSGERAVRTLDSGSFQFNEIGLRNGIFLTYPGLSRALKLSVSDQERQDIIFDYELYNSIIRLAELEARGNREAIYDSLPEQVRKYIRRNDFLDKYSSLYDRDDLVDQYLEVAEVREIKNWTADYGLSGDVVSVTLNNDGAQAEYMLLNNQGAWQLVLWTKSNQK